MPKLRLLLPEAAVEITPVGSRAAGHVHVLDQKRYDWLWIDRILVRGLYFLQLGSSPRQLRMAHRKDRFQVRISGV